MARGGVLDQDPKVNWECKLMGKQLEGLLNRKCTGMKVSHEMRAGQSGVDLGMSLTCNMHGAEMRARLWGGVSGEGWVLGMSLTGNMHGAEMRARLWGGDSGVSE